MMVSSLMGSSASRRCLLKALSDSAKNEADNLIEDFSAGQDLSSAVFLFANVCISSILFTSSKAPVHINGMYHVGVFIFPSGLANKKEESP